MLVRLMDILPDYMQLSSQDFWVFMVPVWSSVEGERDNAPTMGTGPFPPFLSMALAYHIEPTPNSPLQ